VDPYLRVIGVRDMVAVGDCSMMVGERLPATAQVRRQVLVWRCAHCARFLGGPVSKPESMAVAGAQSAWGHAYCPRKGTVADVVVLRMLVRLSSACGGQAG
jgi:hypothetical protein